MLALLLIMERSQGTTLAKQSTFDNTMLQDTFIIYNYMSVCYSPRQTHCSLLAKGNNY